MKKIRVWLFLLKGINEGTPGSINSSQIFQVEELLSCNSCTVFKPFASRSRYVGLAQSNLLLLRGQILIWLGWYFYIYIKKEYGYY